MFKPVLSVFAAPLSCRVRHVKYGLTGLNFGIEVLSLPHVGRLAGSNRHAHIRLGSHKFQDLTVFFTTSPAQQELLFDAGRF